MPTHTLIPITPDTVLRLEDGRPVLLRSSEQLPPDVGPLRAWILRSLHRAVTVGAWSRIEWEHPYFLRTVQGWEAKVTSSLTARRAV